MAIRTVLVSAVLLLGAVLLWVGCSESVSPNSDPAVDELLLDNLEQRPCTPDPGVAPSPLINVAQNWTPAGESFKIRSRDGAGSEPQDQRRTEQPATADFMRTVGSYFLEFWPYTGANFEGIPQDPINLLFSGDCDPRDIMSALLALDGDRSDYEFPPVPPFTSTWGDAIGDVQTAYGAGEWTGSAIQLALGSYEGPRFHLRLFRVGSWTIANAHFEIMIPGTADHQVLSWELAEQLVIADFMRSGLLDENNPIIPVGQINEPDFREIPEFIYNEIPVELRILIGTPLGDVTAPVPIPSDGQAVILNLSSRVDWQADHRIKDFVLNYDIVMPRPFCGQSEYDYVHISGPVHLKQVVSFNETGKYSMNFVANGCLNVTPIDPLTGEPIGEPRIGRAVQKHSSMISDHSCAANGMMFQIVMPVDEPGGGWLYNRLRVLSSGSNQYMSLNECGE